jgi:hypothetical protein
MAEEAGPEVTAGTEVAQPQIKVDRRKSGLLIPAGSAPPEDCPHGQADVERTRRGYRCKHCKQSVYLVTMQTKFMTLAELGEFRKRQQGG